MTLGQFKFWLSKFQVPAEPGLSTAQLMLTNDDLRPGKSMTNIFLERSISETMSFPFMRKGQCDSFTIGLYITDTFGFRLYV